LASTKKQRAAGSPGVDDRGAELVDSMERVSDELTREGGTSERQAGPAETRYAKSGDLSIAYQVVGRGPDVVLVPGSLSHVELGWEIPPWAEIFPRLSGFGRMITFDKRGTGLSDRTAELPTLEERMDDVRAVMDAAHSEKAAVVGASEGGTMALLFAATYPERVTSLVIWGGFARFAWAPDYPDGIDAQVGEQFCDQIEESWGHGRVWPLISTQDAPDDEPTRQKLARMERNSATPSMAAAANRFGLHIDARHALPAISAPTLVVHRSGDPLVSVEHARYIAEHIRGARMSEFPGDAHYSWTGGEEDILDEIEEFLTGTRREPLSERALATVMFTDIVDSTAHAARLGDRRWRQLLDRHDALARGEVERQRGRVVKMTGDGLLATFDGPGRAIECASRLVDGAPSLGLQLRAGLHTGECELRGEDVGGMAVHIGARVAGRAAADEVLVSSTVRDLVVGSGIEFSDRGEAELRGVPGAWRLYAVAGRG
jgi:class 3 adenylate cyclase/alpha-beta hydrolase superfamily lysophospholipase